MPVGTRLPLVSSSVSRANRRGRQEFLGRSRIATCGRLFEGTDEISLGQTSPARVRATTEHLTTATAVTPFDDPPSKPRAMLQNGWHPRRKLLASANAVSITEWRQTTKRGCPQRREPTVRTTTVTSPGLRRHREQTTERRRAVLSPQPVDNYVDSSSSFIWPSLDRPRGGTRH